MYGRACYFTGSNVIDQQVLTPADKDVCIERCKGMGLASVTNNYLFCFKIDSFFFLETRQT